VYIDTIYRQIAQWNNAAICLYIIYYAYICVLNVCSHLRCIITWYVLWYGIDIPPWPILSPSSCGYNIIKLLPRDNIIRDNTIRQSSNTSLATTAAIPILCEWCQWSLSTLTCITYTCMYSTTTSSFPWLGTLHILSLFASRCEKNTKKLYLYFMNLII